MLSERLPVYARLMRIDRPIGTLLLLWPTLWALWIAGNGHPDGQLVLVFVVGVFLMRSAGCVINDFADRHVDGSVARTKSRPLATGEASPREALLLFACLSLAAFMLVLTTNLLTVWLSFAAIVLAAFYPFMKRYTHWPQVFLGAAFGWSIPMAFAAQQGQIPPEAWLIFLANLCWVVAYDTMYAMVDRDDDLRIGIKSTAILFGSWDRHIIGLFQLAFFVLMLVAGQSFDMGVSYHLGLAAAAAIAIRHQRLIYHRQKDQCFKAFLNNNALGAMVFAGIAIDGMHLIFF